ncbi:MAG: class I SAM-dependent methyltransferase [Deltaproteobacteria bacterium]|nr:class I SAM-dependent methyltransferase [Deltaproteobacteria bacterium]
MSNWTRPNRSGRKADAVAENDRTIRDFGDQWSHYGGNEGFYGSLDLLQDMFGPLLATDELRGARVADIGSGTGRIVRMLAAAGAEHIVAVEPSVGVEVLRANVRDLGDRVEVVHATGEDVPVDRGFDFVVSIGVIQFIEDPLPTLQAACRALRPGGRLLIWVYGKEGNELYVGFVKVVRAVTTRLPHAALALVCSALNLLVDIYLFACRWLPLPMRAYMRGTLARVSREQRKLTIYDQLNPSYARYYLGPEVKALLERAGFSDVQLYHRRGYSWTAMGVRPA